MKEIVGALIVLVVGVFVVWPLGRYYRDTYQQQTAHALVTTTPRKVLTKDRDGKEQAGLYSYHYQLDWVLANGTHRKMSVEIGAARPQSLIKGRYVTAEMSKTLIIKGSRYIQRSQLPRQVLDELNTDS